MLVGFYKNIWDKTRGQPVLLSKNRALYIASTPNRNQKRYLTSVQLKRVTFLPEYADKFGYQK